MHLCSPILTNHCVSRFGALGLWGDGICFFWPMVHSKEFIARGSWQAGLLEFLAPRMEKPTTPLRRGETLNHFELGKQTEKKIKGPDNPTCYVFPKDVSSNVHTHVPCAPCMDAIAEHPDAQNAAPATISQRHRQSAAPATISHAPRRARQHPVPLDSCRMRPLPHKHTPRCTECCACHDFGNGIAKVLRLPRFRNGIAKVLRLPRFRTPPAARATTSCPSRQLPNATPATPRCTECCACHDFGNGIAKVLRLPRFRNGIAKVLRLPRFCTPPAARATTSCPSRQLANATPATQTHTQMHRMLRLPRLRQRHRQSAAPATISQRHRQSAAPATISHAPRRARDNILPL